jgi:hypothetical protein
MRFWLIDAAADAMRFLLVLFTYRAQASAGNT